MKLKDQSLPTAASKKVITKSGIDWLPSIPTTWLVKQVKHMYSIQLGKMLQNSPQSELDVKVPYCKAVHVTWDKVATSDLPEMWANPREIKQYQVEEGDLLVCEGGEAGRASVVDSTPSPCIIQNALHRVRGKNGDVRFLKYILYLVSSSGWFDVLCNKATIAHFTREKLAELKIPCPKNIETQSSIANFLDHKIELIDALVAKKERQIELLNEKRQALISHAVTKGLNKSVALKMVDFAGLKELPSHWNVIPLKRIAKIRYGLSQPPGEMVSGVPFIRATNINRGQITRDGLLLVDPDEVPINRIVRLKVGNIIVVRSGAYTGDSAVVTEEFADAIAGYDMVVNFKIGEPSFFSWQFLSPFVLDTQFGIKSMRAAQPHLNAEELGETLLTFPPICEQHAIADYIKDLDSNICTCSQKIQLQIKTLKEYRISLIAAAVTGKHGMGDIALKECNCAI